MWRNWIAHRTSNPEVRGSIPRMGSLLLMFLHISNMKFLAYILLISYLIYVIFGDSIYTKLIFGENITYPPVITEILKRSVFLSYITMLLIALFIFSILYYFS